MVIQSNGYTFHATDSEVLIMKEGTSKFFVVPIKAIQDLFNAVLEEDDNTLLTVKNVYDNRLEKVPTVVTDAVNHMLNTILDNFKDWETRSTDELRMKVAVALRYTEDFMRLFKSRMEAIKKDEST